MWKCVESVLAFLKYWVCFSFCGSPSYWVYCLMSAWTLLVKVNFNVTVGANLQAWAYCMLKMSLPWTKQCLWLILWGLVMTVIDHLPAPVHQSPSSQIHTSCHVVFLTVLRILMKCQFYDECHTFWFCGILCRILGDDHSNMADVCTLMNNIGSFTLSKSVPYHGSGDYSQISHSTEVELIPGQSMWYFW
jgi:hypothetical protein